VPIIKPAQKHKYNTKVTQIQTMEHTTTQQQQNNNTDEVLGLKGPGVM
jgi:hypothetical protein